MKDKILNILLKMKPYTSYVVYAIFAIYFAVSIPAVVKIFIPGSYVTIDGKKFSLDDIEKESSKLVIKYKKELMDKQSSIFNKFADEKIQQIEAKKRGITVEKLLDEKTDFIPSEEEKRSIFEKYKNSFKGKKFEEVESEISNYLINKNDNDRMRKLMTELRNKYGVEIFFEKLPEVREDVAIKGNPVLGPANAKVTIIEFSDFECPFCKRSQAVTKELRERYKDSVKWVFRDFPLSFHQNAMFAHMAANCAIPQGKYWEFFNVLFENSGNLEKNQVLNLAKESGLDMTSFNQCLTNEEALKREIEQDITDGQSHGVSGTPAFFINGIMVEGAQPIQNFVEIIEKELKAN